MAPRNAPTSDAAQRRLLALRWLVLIGAFGVVVGLLTWHLNAARLPREAQLAQDFGAQLVAGPAPDIEVTRRDGTKMRLSELRGKVVFVNFWATWCPPCRKEIPDLEALAQLMQHVPFEILAVSSDDSWETLDGFFAGGETRMRVGLDPKQAWAAHYGTEKLPETYVVDREGNLRLRFINIQPWTDERIHRYLEWLATSG